MMAVTMREAYILSACRTPIGKFQGAIESFSAVELGTATVKEAIRRAEIAPESVDEVIMGNVLSAGLGQNPARQTALKSGIPSAVSALTINKVCGSGLKAVTLAAQGIQVEDIEIAVSGGMESMTNAPYLVPNGRKGFRMGNAQVVDSMIHDGLWDVYNDYHMGNTAELVCDRYEVNREDQDRYAVESHRRAVEAWESCFFKDEVLPIEVPQRKGDPVVFSRDEGPRADTNPEAMARLRPVFKRDGGRVTAGNSSQLSDGAAALVVASETAVESQGLQPMARIVASATAGVDPELVLMAPIHAIEKVRKRAGWEDEAVDLYEVNEAFASQCVAISRQLPLDPEKLNVNGGGIALGHPIGCSGARILTTLLYALKNRGLKRGIASLCLGGGNGVAMAVELV